jgi:hypothetical protein
MTTELDSQRVWKRLESLSEQHPESGFLAIFCA